MKPVYSVDWRRAKPTMKLPTNVPVCDTDGDAGDVGLTHICDWPVVGFQFTTTK